MHLAAVNLRLGLNAVLTIISIDSSLCVCGERTMALRARGLSVALRGVLLLTKVEQAKLRIRTSTYPIIRPYCENTVQVQ